MAANLNAWTDGQAPNSAHLQDLLRMAEGRLEQSVASFRELLPHFESAHQQARSAQNSLRGMLEENRSLSADVQNATQSSLRAFEDLISLFEELLELQPYHGSHLYWEALRGVEETAGALQERALHLGSLAKEA